MVAADRIRVSAHLERVEARLRTADVSHLSPAQRAARARNLDRLHAYRLRGEFPYGVATQPARLSPTFIDADGRACAMAYLVIESGHRDVAEAIARDQLHARVPEIRHPALGPWLVANGMTLEEATEVQPTYCFADGEDGGVLEREDCSLRANAGAPAPDTGTTESSDGSGCGCRVRRGRPTPALALVLLLIAARLARRRRSHR